MGTEVERLEEINCHHNYTEPEEHYGELVAVPQGRDLRPGQRAD